MERKEELYSNKKHAIPELRFLDDLERYLEKLGYVVPAHFDWWQLYVQLYEEKHVHDVTFNTFKIYLSEIHPFLVEVKSYIDEQYESVGRVELMKKIGLIREMEADD